MAVKGGVLLAACLGLLLAMPGKATTSDCPTMEAVLSESKSFTLLLTVARALNMTELLEDPESEVTLWAPSDSLFTSALSMLKLTPEQALEPEYASLLQQVVSAHVTPAPYMDLAEMAGEDIETMDPETQLLVNAEEGSVTPTNPEVSKIFQMKAKLSSTEPMVACKSAIYTLEDTIIVPPSLVTDFLEDSDILGRK